MPVGKHLAVLGPRAYRVVGSGQTEQLAMDVRVSWTSGAACHSPLHEMPFFGSNVLSVICPRNDFVNCLSFANMPKLCVCVCVCVCALTDCRQSSRGGMDWRRHKLACTACKASLGR